VNSLESKFAMREFHILRGWRRRLAIDGSLIILLTLTGPFGTFVDLVAPLRLGYWTAIVAGCSILMHLVVGATLATPWLGTWPAPSRIALGSVLAAFPCAALVGLLERVMRQNDAVFDHYFWFWFCVTIIGFPVALLQFAAFGARRASSSSAPIQEVAHAPKQEAAEIRFLSRLPDQIGREIISLSMQDHYVEVTTSRGSTMLLMRFSDAVGELAGYPGAQVHRSHWVAGGQAKRLLRDKDRRMIELVDGRRLPVSRPYLDEARKLLGVDSDLDERADRPE
jgi:DNA-binding LytR/AlgR family response regulator